MNHTKSVVIAVVMLAAVAGIAWALSTTGMQTTHKWALIERGDSGAAGQALFYWNDMDGLHRATLKVWVWDLVPMDDFVYEGWLVDEDTGYALSTGALQTNAAGKGFQYVEQVMVHPHVYDKYVLTREPMHDTDPRPGLPVLEGMVQ